jgi:hypothetical protein
VDGEQVFEALEGAAFLAEADYRLSRCGAYAGELLELIHGDGIDVDRCRGKLLLGGRRRKRRQTQREKCGAEVRRPETRPPRSIVVSDRRLTAGVFSARSAPPR